MLQRRPHLSGLLGPLARALVPWLVLGYGLRAEEAAPGERIYRRKCASCHGADGEGTPEYRHPLAGDRSPGQLATLIARTMPEDDPGTCVGEDAEQVAAYIHGAFYSPAAKARNQPARIDLSRLTVSQYRNAVADLLGSFRPDAPRDDAKGLRGQYFKSRKFQDKDRGLDRIDPEVGFDFQDAAPAAEGFNAHVFSIRWEGSVLAPETGEYEFNVRSEHAVRLWVNDEKRPLVDALVKSGDDVDHRGSIPLLGGRAYPLKLEFSKAKQGVDDSKKNGQRPPGKASISLFWKPPHRAEEVVPSRNLSPAKPPELFVAATPFPPDDRSVGYERGASVSAEWERATTAAAIEAAGYVVDHLNELAGTNPDAPDREARLREFCRRFAERATRRPLSGEQAQFYVDRRFEKAPDLETAVKRAVLLVLKSPRFLYREAGGGPPDAFDVASRLAFGLWDSLPDAPLLKAAAAGQLATREQVARQAERMAADPRTRAKLREFLRQWLKVDQARDIAKDPALFPEFTPEVVSDLRTSLELTLDEMAWGEASDYRQLLNGEGLFLNGRLAKLYGADLPPDAPFQKVTIDAADRAGVLSHPYLLATFAYTSTSSPIHRGVFLSRSVLGRSLRPPPQAVAPLAPDLHPDLTTRERVALQTSPASCQTCHGMINPLGFALERFDAIGRYRSEDKGRPVDASGSYHRRDGETATFAGARELAAFLAGSQEAHGAFVEHLFHHLVKQPIAAYGPDTLLALRASFAANGYHIRKLAVEILATSALAARPGNP